MESNSLTVNTMSARATKYIVDSLPPSKDRKIEIKNSLKKNKPSKKESKSNQSY